MSHSTTIEVVHVDTPATPRIATLIDLLFSAFAGLFERTPPAVSTRVQEAAAVRNLAQSLMDTDPAFAADLYAAACRHEIQDERPGRR
jgi:hypothetical protein